MQRLGQPQEIANVIGFLLSSAASMSPARYGMWMVA
jgi:NAD(P)-dependent dehydrogenase (short-subunit alcohol dehydrogenase family)